MMHQQRTLFPTKISANIPFPGAIYPAHIFIQHLDPT